MEALLRRRGLYPTAFVLPIATAFLFANVKGWWLRGIVLLLTLYLLGYNGYLLTDFLLTPIRTTL